jgi:hypothetical protein
MKESFLLFKSQAKSLVQLERNRMDPQQADSLLYHQPTRKSHTTHAHTAETDSKTSYLLGKGQPEEAIYNCSKTDVHSVAQKISHDKQRQQKIPFCLS